MVTKKTIRKKAYEIDPVAETQDQFRDDSDLKFIGVWMTTEAQVRKFENWALGHGHTVSEPYKSGNGWHVRVKYND